MIRFICVALFLFLFLVLSIPVLLVVWVIGKFDRQKKDMSSLRIVQWAFKVILWITGVEVTVIGEENVPDEPVLFIGNHRSYFDILLTYSRCRRLTGYVAKKEMKRYPLLSTWMEYLYCLFIPISMNTTDEMFDNHLPKIKKTHVILEYGKPIYPKALDADTRKHLGRYCEDLIRETITRNAGLI